LPSVNALYQQFEKQGLEVLLIAFREDPDLVRRTVQERGYIAPVLLDQSGEVAGKRYGVWGPPTVYVIDREGRLIARAVGPRSWDSPTARALVEALLLAPTKS
jgi:peroxiredoxin